MRQEKIKTGILILLICSALALAASVWFGSGIWPRGYDFFVTLPDRAFFSQLFRKTEPYVSPMENLAKPEKLIVTSGENRAVYYNTDASYTVFYETVLDFFRTTLPDDSAVLLSTAVGESEWYDVLRNDEILDTKSIYIDYSTAFSPQLFAKVCGVENTWLEAQTDAVREFILAPNGDAGEDVLLYMRNNGNNAVKKLYIKYAGKSTLFQKIAAMTENVNYSYAFELNLHDSQVGIGAGVEQKVVMDPLLVISPRSTESAVISGQNPIGDGTDTHALLSAFHYREYGVNRYTGTDGTQHFIENYGALHIYPDGVIEYYAVEEKRGVRILQTENSTATLYDSLNGAVTFAERVWRALVPDQSFDALVSSDLLEETPGVYTFTLDYYYEGTPIISLASGSMHAPMQHAAEITVQNGYIVGYRHFIRRFADTGETVTNIPMLQAIDGIYAQLTDETEQIRITDLFLAYLEDTGEELKKPVWCARVEGRDELVYYTP